MAITSWLDEVMLDARVASEGAVGRAPDSINLSLVVLIALALSACNADPNRSDPRAYPGSSAGISLEEAAERSSVTLATESRQARFSFDQGIENYFALNFSSSCAVAEEFVSRNGLPPLRAVLSPMPLNAIMGASLDHGWEIDSAPGARVSESHLGDRAAAVVPREGQECDTYFVHQTF